MKATNMRKVELNKRDHYDGIYKSNRCRWHFDLSTAQLGEGTKRQLVAFVNGSLFTRFVFHYAGSNATTRTLIHLQKQQTHGLGGVVEGFIVAVILLHSNAFG
jgi:hypothetical protein